MIKTSRLMVASLIALVAGTSLATGNAVATTGSVTSELTVDCLNPPEESLNAWNYQSETITVTFTNCDAWSWDDSNGDPIGDPVVSPLTITPGDYLSLYNIGANTQVSIDSGILVEARTPPGEIQFTQNVTMGLNPDSFSAGTSDRDDEHFLGGKRLCALDVDGGPRHVYTTLDITIVKAGTYTFRAIDSSPVGYYIGDSDWHPIADSFLALYSSFDPEDPDANVIGCNDDLNDKFGYDNSNVAEVLADGSWMEGHHPYFAAELEPGEYTLLVTTWEALSNAEWRTGVSGSRSWTPGEATLTFELWGPVASLCVGHDPACDPVDPTLPPTGSRSTSAVYLSITALLIGLAGTFTVRRRATLKN